MSDAINSYYFHANPTKLLITYGEDYNQIRERGRRESFNYNT